jgi:acyl-CoA thioesterase II
VTRTADELVRTEQRPPELMTDILGLEQLEVDVFRGRSPDEALQRVFGGQVAGQALVAAGRTVPDARPVHSLHAYFLRPGDPTVPIVYTVDRIRDGRAFSTGRIVAIQHGRAIFTLSASFHVAEPGADHQFTMSPAPDPATVPLWQDRLREFGERVPARWLRPRPVEVRYVGDPPWAASDGDPEPRTMVWMRSVGRPLPDDSLLHVCTAAYASDMTLLDSVLLAQGWPGPRTASPARAWNTRCGSTLPSAPINGCSTFRRRPSRRVPVVWRAATSTVGTDAWRRPSCRRGSSALPLPVGNLFPSQSPAATHRGTT